MGRRKRKKSGGARSEAQSAANAAKTSSQASGGDARTDNRFGRLLAIGIPLILIVCGAVWRLGFHSSADVDANVNAESSSLTRAEDFSMAAAVTSSLETSRQTQRERELNEHIEASNDGWSSEAISDSATGQLRIIAQYLKVPTEANTEKVRQVVSADSRFQAIVPTALTEHYRDQNLFVRHLVDSEAADSANAGSELAIETLCSSLASIAVEYQFSEAKLKVFHIDLDTDSATTNASFEASGKKTNTVESSSFQITANWQCDWEISSTAKPLLKSIRIIDYEEVVANHKKGRWLSDCTEAVLGKNKSLHRELSVGMDDWVNRLDSRLMVSRFGHHGITIGDANGDGLDDVYISQPGGLPNRLFVQQADGTAIDVSAQSKVDFLDASSNAIFADLDNDDDQDLIVAALPAVVVFSNDGKGTFSPRVALPDCPRSFSLCVADYDSDGLLDIYACRYRNDTLENFELPLPVPYYDANNGGRNVLFRNRGNWQFEDVTEKTGLEVDNSRFSFAASWEDFDNDGDADLYVANDYGRNCLYQNANGHFRNVAADFGVEDIASGMSVSWSDFNSDGLMDLYVSNMFSSAGNRIAFQRQFGERFDDVAQTTIQRHARGNTLFESRRDADGEISFRDVSVESSVTMGRWAWGSLFADINNDGRDDILVTNGLMTTEDTGDL